MNITISYENGEFFVASGALKRNRNKRIEKGKSLISFPVNYVVFDVETTGLDPSYDEIIEISAIKVVDNEIVDIFSELVKPEYEIDEFITELTGITNEMLSGAPALDKVLPKFLEFVKDNILVGHNVNFDVNFIYDNSIKLFQKPFSNDFIDTLRLARKVLPELKHHRLDDLIKYYNLSPRNEHRALNDSTLTFEVFKHIEVDVLEKYGTIESFQNQFKRKSKTKQYKASDIKATSTDFDESNPLFNKNVVFTGALEKITRKDAMQVVVNLGGKCTDTVTKTTDFLVLGNKYYYLKNEKSSKRLKAEKMKLEGHHIEILSEEAFYDLLDI